MAKFKVGDKVKVVDLKDLGVHKNVIGRNGIITEILLKSKYNYGAEVEGEEIAFYEDELELYTETPNKVKIVQVDKTMDLPKYQTKGSSGMDLMARCFCQPFNLSEELNYDSIELYPQKRMLIKTGIKIKMPTGLEAQVRCRSGLALKNGIMVVNGVGTIDEDFTGEIGVILYNSSDEPFLIKKGDRIAQLVFQKIEQYEWDVVDTLEETERSDGGYGHTGVQSNV